MPEAPIYDLVDMFESWEKVQELSEQISGVRAQLTDPQGKFIAGRESLPTFCQLIRSSKLGEHRCHKSYSDNCFKGAKRESTVFECHAGLTSVAFPLVVSRKVVGAILGGRTLAPGKKVEVRKLRALADELGIDADELVSAAQAIQHADSSAFSTFGKLIKPFVDSLASTIFRYSNLIEKTESLIDAAKESEKLLFIDRLTGLFNQHYFKTRLGAEVSRAQRYHHPLALIFMELDDFDESTASYGHLAQDVMLKEVAALILKSARKTEVVFRYDEVKFAVILPEADHEKAFKLAERVRKAIAVKSFGKEADLDVQLTMSMGISALFKDVSSGALIERADKVLDQARKEGGNRIRISPVPEGATPAAKGAPHVFAPHIDKRRRVVITGLGAITPIGIGKDAFWKACKAGKSGIDRIQSFDPSDLPTQIAGEVRDFHPEEYINPKDLRRMDRFTQFAVAAAKMAVEDAGLDQLESKNDERIGVSIGSALGGLAFAEEQDILFREGGWRKLSPFLAIRLFPGSSSSQVSLMFGMKAFSMTASTGCVTGADAIAIAFDGILKNEVDVVIAGGAEASLMAPVIGSFCVIKALSTRNDEPKKASRPFDLKRDGFVMSEGAGILILEELQHALKRGAHIYGEVLGYGATCDAYHMTRPAPDGQEAARGVRIALRNAGLKPTDVDYLNAHGTSTPLNDATETKAIKDVFGDHATKLPVSSIKSMIGHTFGGSGAIEFVTCALAMQDNFIPPTINYEEPDPDCDLDYVPNKGREAKIDVAMSNSFGFGGKNTILVLGKYREGGN